MTRIAESFAWPFRARPSTWAIGILAVLLLPLLFIPLLGYAIAATRAAAADPPAQVPPAWSVSRRLLADGFWTSLVIALTVLPFALALGPLATALSGLARGTANAYVATFLVLALPWGLLALLVLPHATAAFAESGRPLDLFDFASSLHSVRHEFATWNVVVVAIVTGWAIALASLGALCVGIAPGIFYAILVSAHATSPLRRPRPHAPAG